MLIKKLDKFKITLDLIKKFTKQIQSIMYNKERELKHSNQYNIQSDENKWKKK